MTATETRPRLRDLEIEELPVAALIPGFDFRLDDDSDDLAELAASIAEHGVLQPLLVTRLNDEQWEIVAGRRRHAAARQAGLDVVPCVIRALTRDQATDAAIAENIHRRNLSPIEEALAFAHLRDSGLTQTQIGKRVGRSQTHVSMLLRLLELPPDVRADIHAGKLSYATALKHPGRVATGERQGGGFNKPRARRRRSRARVVLAPPARPDPRRPLRHPEGTAGGPGRMSPHDRQAREARHAAVPGERVVTTSTTRSSRSTTVCAAPRGGATPATQRRSAVMSRPHDGAVPDLREVLDRIAGAKNLLRHARDGEIDVQLAISGALKLLTRAELACPPAEEEP